MRLKLFVGASAGVIASGWIWLLPITPVDTPYFHWQPTPDDRFELTVNHINGNPEFHQGVTTTPVPQSGTLRVVGPPGAAQPGATLEVSNPRTGRGYSDRVRADGSFNVEAEARRGDTLEVISRKIEFRAVQAPRYSSSALSSPQPMP